MVISLGKILIVEIDLKQLMAEGYNYIFNWSHSNRLCYCVVIHDKYLYGTPHLNRKPEIPFKTFNSLNYI